MLHPSIHVRTSAISGLGTFAVEPIPAGTVVWRRDAEERSFTRAEIARWPASDAERFWRLAYQVAPDHWSGPGPTDEPDPADYMNHSCQPTSGFEGNECLVALRTIPAGEEVTYDYVMSETGDFRMDCRCGAPRCRGLVTGADLIVDPTLRGHYLGRLMSHVELEVEAQVVERRR